MIIIPNPILFLDIDGVLNSVQFYTQMHELHAKLGQGVYSLDPGAVAVLQRIVSETDCDIVIMSTWRRLHTLARISELLQLQGYDGEPPIIGATPISNTANAFRGNEVSRYLESRYLDMRSYKDSMTRIACLDDDGDFYPYQNLVQCDNEYGLTESDAEKVIELLKPR